MNEYDDEWLEYANLEELLCRANNKLVHKSKEKRCKKVWVGKTLAGNRSAIRMNVAIEPEAHFRLATLESFPSCKSCFLHLFWMIFFELRLTKCSILDEVRRSHLNLHYTLFMASSSLMTQKLSRFLCQNTFQTNSLNMDRRLNILQFL